MPQATATGTLTDAQLAGYAKGAGFPAREIPTAVAVARAESSGNPRARNGVPCLGLWQINMSGRMGPDRRKALGVNSNEALYDPALNAKAAYMIYRAAGNSWKPWSTYTSGAYKKYLSETPADGGSTPMTADEARDKIMGAYDRATPWGKIASEIHSFTETARRQSWNWLIILLALVLLILGFVILNRARLKTAAKIGVGVVTKGAL